MNYDSRFVRAWHLLGRMKLVPLLIAIVVSVVLPFGLIVRVLIGTALYLLLYFIRWNRADGTRAFPPYIW